MRISAKIEYACQALLELSIHWPNKEPLQVQKIAQRQGIPLKFLTQILIALKQTGCVQSLRGKSGGYLLNQPPKDIILGDIVRQLGEQDAVKTEKSRQGDVMSSIWTELDSLIWNKLDSISFESILNRKISLEQTMSFDI
jgi:Rrf2 family protein